MRGRDDGQVPVRKAKAEHQLMGLHLRVLHYLGQEIARGELTEGSQIVVERVAAVHDVSRPVVREVLKVLEAKGMVLPRPRVGTRVLGVDAWDLLDEDVIHWRLRGPDRDVQLRDLLELRASVEPYAARECCAAAGPADVQRMHAAAKQIEQATSQRHVSDLTAADIDFHTALLTASGNWIFRQLSTAIAVVLREREELGLGPHSHDDAAIASHRVMAEAIEDNDPDRAEAAARLLIAKVTREFADSLGWLARGRPVQEAP